MSKKAFISYNWQEPTSGIVNNWLYPNLAKLKGKDIDVSVDRKDCKYHDSIEEFEKKLGEAELVIAVISEPYFHSLHCMYEVASVIERGNVAERLYLIVAINKLPPCDLITEEWERRAEELEMRLVKTKHGKEPIEKELRQINFVLKHIGALWVYMEDRNRLDFSGVSKNNFQKLVDRLKGNVVKADYNSDELLKGIDDTTAPTQSV